MNETSVEGSLFFYAGKSLYLPLEPLNDTIVMLILLSCAKTMTAVSKTKVPFCTTPLFQLNATEIALQMTQYSVEELEALLRVDGKIAFVS